MLGKILKFGIIAFVGVIGLMLAIPSGMISLLLAAVAIVTIGGTLR